MRPPDDRSHASQSRPAAGRRSLAQPARARARCPAQRADDRRGGHRRLLCAVPGLGGLRPAGCRGLCPGAGRRLRQSSGRPASGRRRGRCPVGRGGRHRPAGPGPDPGLGRRPCGHRAWPDRSGAGPAGTAIPPDRRAGPSGQCPDPARVRHPAARGPAPGRRGPAPATHPVRGPQFRSLDRARRAATADQPAGTTGRGPAAPDHRQHRTAPPDRRGTGGHAVARGPGLCPDDPCPRAGASGRRTGRPAGLVARPGRRHPRTDRRDAPADFRRRHDHQ